jgi:hypothetical protein
LAGLVPAIHAVRLPLRLAKQARCQGVGGRDKPGNDVGNAKEALAGRIKRLIFNRF